MEPLSDEQLIELDEISKLPPEEQQIKVKEFFSKLSPGQIEWLKNQQQQTSGSQCPFCLIVEGKIKARVVYNDNLIIAALDINPANKGHIVVFPKEHVKDSFEMDANLFLNLMSVSNKIGGHVKGIVNANGVNILISNGATAGQRIDHFIVHVIPRFEGDKVKFTWENQKVSEDEMNQIIEGFRTFSIGPIINEEANVEEVKIDENKEYFYTDDADRIP